MNHRESTPTTKTEAAGLAQQKADFTSEGSPPQGQVASTPPATADTPKSPVRHARASTNRANKRVPWSSSP